MKEMKTLTVNGITYAVTDPTAPRIDDSVIGDAPWSAKKIVDTLCPAFTATGNPVVCTPVEGYPLEVTSDSTVKRCGRNLLDMSGNAVKEITHFSNGAESAAYWGVELILPPGTYTLRAVARETGIDYIYGQVNDLEKTQRLRGWSRSVARDPGAAGAPEVAARRPFLAGNGSVRELYGSQSG